MPKIFVWIILIIIAVLGMVTFLDRGQGTRHKAQTDNDFGQDKMLEDAYNQKETMKAKIITNMGDVELELNYQLAPNTVDNFVSLVGSKFYDGTRFHRVIKGFMIQGGDPLTKDVANKAIWGTGGPGYQFDDEFGEGLSNVVGTISMANSGPNTNGSQFFINTADNTFLDGKHAVFGRVIDGMEVVTKIENNPTEPRDVPIDDVIIETIELLTE